LTVVEGAEAERREGVVLRPELFARLEHAHRVTLVAAPAGSGKSYLLRSWARANKHLSHTAWVTIDRFEPTPQRFWVNVVDALRATVPGKGTVHALSEAPVFDGWAVVERLLSAVTAMEETVWLVVDDLHELSSKDALGQLELFVMRAPPSVRFVFATRREPPIPLHHLRVEGELTEIRADDLRFTFDEARELFAEAHVELSNEAIESLVDRTEGWVAGLRLAALCLIAHPDPEAFLRGFSGSERTVAEYLMAEVLDQQPEPVRRLLLRTSIVEHVTGSLADHLTGTTGGEEILQELDRANAFVMAIDTQRTIFRYHPLFAELLQSVLRREEPESIKELHRSAAHWYADNGMVMDAVRCALAAEDWTLAKTILLHNFFKGISPDEQLGVVGDLLAAFPTTNAHEDAIVPSMTAVNEVIRGAIDSARRSLEVAEATLSFVAPSERTHVDAVMAMARVSIARESGDAEAGLAASRAMLEAAAGTDWVRLGLGDASRALALTTLGVTELWSHQPDEAERDLEQAAVAARRAGRPYLLVTVLSHHAMSAMARNPALAEARGREAIELAEAHGWAGEPLVTMARLALATSFMWRGRLEEAEAELDLVCSMIRPEARPLDALLHRYLVGLLEFARRRVDEATVAFDHARRMGGLVAVTHTVLLKSHALWLHCLLRQGDVDRVAIEVEKLEHSSRDSGEMRTVAAAVQMMRGDPATALATLAPVVDGSVPPMRPYGWQVQPLLFAARAHDELGDADALADALERALDLAEPQGEVLPFLLHGDADLLERHRRRGSSHASLLSQIIDCFTGVAQAPGSDFPFALRDPLTARETRVLRYLPTNLTTREIAEEMYVSVNTVKTHMRHLYDKLGVDRRGDAVARARSLGLLAPARHN
jgi:LuxR family maltose regulon positive regulatory protein